MQTDCLDDFFADPHVELAIEYEKHLIAGVARFEKLFAGAHAPERCAELFQKRNVNGLPSVIRDPIQAAR